MKKHRIYDTDPYLLPYKEVIDHRTERISTLRDYLSRDGSLSKGMNNHLYYGLHRTENGGWVFREWAPNATRMYLVGDFNNWQKSPAYALHPVGSGNWEITLDEFFVRHGDLYKLFVEWPGGGGERIPAYVTRAVQDPDTKVFSAQVWDPQKPYVWKKKTPKPAKNPLIYECHIGMSSEREEVASFDSFRKEVLPRVKKLGYNTLQIMALQEHPYYGSFGYQVSNFYALSSRFGTPEQFKALVDAAHGLGISVVMDIVHSHSVSNELEGLGKFDGHEDLYFYPGERGRHPAWGSRCFDYGKDEVRNFLLSNLKFWLEEYHLDGFRFDGVTSMLYWDHGLGRDFVGYEPYFDGGVDENAIDYLALANMLIRELRPDAITIAEDVSGLAGLAAPFEEGGIGFGFRMAMGIADHWIKWIKEKSDWDWSPGEMWYELTNKRADERTVSYAECHDQALVGDKTLIFRLIDKEMYTAMNCGSRNDVVNRGVALHKMIRLATAATCGGGYLNFMGNEFGHPEWIDFPREGNSWSFKYARRQWSLADSPFLRYSKLNAFDGEMIRLLKKTDVLTETPECLMADESKKVLIFKRKNHIFAFNFHPTESFFGYGFECPDGVWGEIFNTDRVEFDGFGRYEPGETHCTLLEKRGNDKSVSRLYLYLPCRTAIVLEKLKK